TEGKALKVLLGTAGDAFYANAATGYTDSFARFRVNSVDVFAVSGTAITTTDTFSQTGSATFSTGTGAISLNGPIALNDNTTIAAGKGITVTTGGAGNFDFHNSTGTFDTSTGAVTLRGNTATASGVTFTAGSGIVNAVNAVSVTTGLLTTGSAIRVDVGASAPVAQNSTQGLGLDITSSGAFAGLSNVASL